MGNRRESLASGADAAHANVERPPPSCHSPRPLRLPLVHRTIIRLNRGIILLQREPNDHNDQKAALIGVSR